MPEKITTTKHIRQQLEDLHQKKYNTAIKKKPNRKLYQGLQLNWRTNTIIMLVLFYVGLYQVQARAQDYFRLDAIDTGMMLFPTMNKVKSSRVKQLALPFESK